MHNIIVAVEQTIPDLQKKWTRFGDNRRVYAKYLTPSIRIFPSLLKHRKYLQLLHRVLNDVEMVEILDGRVRIIFQYTKLFSSMLDNLIVGRPSIKSHKKKCNLSQMPFISVY